MASNNKFSNWKTAVRGGLHGIVANQVDDKVRQAIVDAGLTPEDMKNPKSVLTFAVALVACVPEAIRKPVLLALAGIIRTDPRFAGLSSWAVPELLEGVDSGIDGTNVDAAALREALFAKLDGSAKGAILNATKIAEGAAWVSRTDGGFIHRANCSECTEAHKAGDPHGKPEVMFTLYPHRAPCPKCWSITGNVVTVKSASDKPAEGPSIVDTLLADRAGDRSIERALAVFGAIMELRGLELINQPTKYWHLALMHRKGLPKTPKALSLLPPVSVDEKLEFDEHHRAMMAAHAAGTDPATADRDAVLMMVSHFGGYIEHIKLIAERDVNDIWEGLARAVDFVDDRITATQRNWLVKHLISRKPLYILGAIVLVYLVSYVGTWAVAALITLFIINVTMGLFDVGAILLLSAAYSIVVWPLDVFPMHFLFVGWCVAFVVLATAATFDGMFGKVKALLQGWIPGKNAGFGTWLASTAVHWARKWDLVPPISAEEAKAEAPKPGDGIRRATLAMSIAASIIFLIASFLSMMGDVMVQGGHADRYLAMMAIVMIGLTVEWGRRFHYLYTWDDRIRLNKRAMGVLLGGLVAIGLLLGCGGVVNSLLGGRNLQFAHKGVQQEFGELVGAAGPENYPRGSQGYCEVYPQDHVCGGWKTDAEVQADAKRRQAKRK